MANILVVDDDKTLLGDITEILTAAGHRIVTADHPPQALMKIQNEAFELVITDLNMPHMSGHDFIQLLQNGSKTKNIYIAILSSSKDMHDVVNAAQNGIRDYVLKPIEAQSLVKKVETMLVKANELYAQSSAH